MARKKNLKKIFGACSGDTTVNHSNRHLKFAFRVVLEGKLELQKKRLGVRGVEF